MTQEDKDLLLQDLCGRLAYQTQVYAQNDIDWYEDEICTQVLSDVINNDYTVKPYLFPMSSMTEEQKEEYCQLQQKIIYNSKGPVNTDIMNYINWCYKNHIDVNELIPLGLALDATGLNIY